MQAERSSYHYSGKRTDPVALKRRIKELAKTRVRYGYRRIAVLLKQEGWPVNGKRIYRLYRELGLQLRNKTPKRKVKAKLGKDRQAAPSANDIWAMDLMPEQLFDGRKIRILAVIDLFSQFSPTLDPRFSDKAQNVVETLDWAASVAGYPRTIRVDNGPKFVSRDLDLWAFEHGVTLDFGRLGKPTDNAFAESCNGKVRAECLNTAWFLSLDDARRKCETWRRDYNDERPHSSIGDKWPIELMNGAGPYGPPGT